jgi:hypothetical protein
MTTQQHDVKERGLKIDWLSSGQQAYLAFREEGS